MDCHTGAVSSRLRAPEEDGTYGKPYGKKKGRDLSACCCQRRSSLYSTKQLVSKLREPEKMVPKGKTQGKNIGHDLAAFAIVIHGL